MRAQLACLRTVTPPSEGLPIGSPTPSACFSASASTPTEVGPTPTTSKTSPMPTTALKPSRCASRRPAVKPSGRETREALDSRWPPAFRFPSRCSRHASGRRHPAATGQSRPNRAVPKPVPLSRRTGPVPRGTHTPTHTTHPARHTIALGGMAGRRLLTTLRVRLTAEDTVDNSRRSPPLPQNALPTGRNGRRPTRPVLSPPASTARLWAFDRFGKVGLQRKVARSSGSRSPATSPFAHPGRTQSNRRATSGCSTSKASERGKAPDSRSGASDALLGGGGGIEPATFELMNPMRP